jgi:hypothetical protein
MIKAIIIGLVLAAAVGGAGYAAFHKTPAKSPPASKAAPAAATPSANPPAASTPAPSTAAPASPDGSASQSNNSSPAPAYSY